MAVLVTGGAGYIGSHTVLQLLKSGEKVIVIDNLSTGKMELLSPKAKFYFGDFGDSELIKKIIKDEKIESVIHFAAFIVVSESVMNPFKYYENNFIKSFNLIRTCFEENVNKFIFSSTAAVYGDSKLPFVCEKTETQPLNAYGNSKLSVERLLNDISMIPESKFNYVILRYFNVSGANSDGVTGQVCVNSTHLIKVASETALGLRDYMSIYGTDYSTKDGTCIRDYIHVDDLAIVHCLALQYLKNNGESEIFNCGYGNGYSVKEVIEVMKKESGVNFKVKIKERRAGDSEKLIADPSLLKEKLKWSPQFNDLSLICKTALNWEKQLIKDVKK